MDCSMPGFSVLHHLLELTQTHVHESVMSYNHFILCCSLLMSSIFPSIRVFSIELALWIKRPKYWSISPSNEYSGLISFRIHRFDFFAVQGTFKNLLQYHSSKVSILWCSAYIMVHFSHPYMTIGKILALTILLQNNIFAF